MFIKRGQIEKRKRRILNRLENSSSIDRGRPMFSPGSSCFEFSDRIQAKNEPPPRASNQSRLLTPANPVQV